MQSCWDNGCINSGLRPQEVIVVWWLPWVRNKMIRLYTYKHLASPFTQVRTLCLCTVMYLFGILSTYTEYTGTYKEYGWVCVCTLLLFTSCHLLLCSLIITCTFSFFSPPISSLPGRVTREHRENLVKLAKQFGNKAKDSLRRVRSNAITQVKKAKEGHSEDTIRLVEKQVWDREKKHIQ